VLFVQSIQYALIIQPMLSIGPKQRDDEAEIFFGAILSHQLAFAGLCVAVVVAGAFAVDGLFPGLGIDGFALVVAAAVLACQMQDFVRRRLFVRGRPGAAFLNDVVRYVGQIGLLIWLFSRGGLTTIDVLWLLSAVSALAALLGAFSLERPVPTLSVLRGTARRNWSSSSWLTLSAVLHWASSQLFIAAAGALLGASAVGALRAAENLIGGIANIYFLGLENVVPARAAWHCSTTSPTCAWRWSAPPSRSPLLPPPRPSFGSPSSSAKPTPPTATCCAGSRWSMSSEASACMRLRACAPSRRRALTPPATSRRRSSVSARSTR
jgi:hypothetical protein